MARLRIRIELNRGGVGVPLHKLAHVVGETQRFFRMLGEDVHIGRDGGEWLGFDFDQKSLNFTAEYVGPVSASQVQEFYAAFDGVTQLRRATIVQFARIADAIDEDELIGFGLYQDDRDIEPGEWRSLSKREALRITEEIHLLIDQADGESRIPAALDPGVAASLFKGRDHGAGGRRLEGLAERVERLEQEVTGHSESILTLKGTTAKTEQNLENLLVAVDSFCEKATKQMERLPPGESSGETNTGVGWRLPATVAAVSLVGGWLLFQGIWEPREPAQGVQAAYPAAKQTAVPPIAAPIAAPKAVPIGSPAVLSNAPPNAPRPAVTAPAPKPSAPKASEPGAGQKIELKAISPTWVGIYIDDKLTFGKLLETDQTKVVEAGGPVKVRVGNSAGVEMSVNGKPVGEIGRSGQAKTVVFTAGEFKIAP